jgi:hypothetical protein
MVKQAGAHDDETDASMNDENRALPARPCWNRPFAFSTFTFFPLDNYLLVHYSGEYGLARSVVSPQGLG